MLSSRSIPVPGLLFAVVSSIALTAPDAQAQAPVSASATVVLVRSLAEPGARATVIRRGAPSSPENIVLVTSATTPADLAKAMGALIFSRRGRGAAPAREMRAHITPAAAPAKQTSDEKRAERDLRRLRAAPALSIAGIASGPAIRVRLPEERAKSKE